MTEEIKMLVCKINLRPSEGGSKLIEAGTPFPETLMNPETKTLMLEHGELAYAEEEAPVAEKPKAPTAKEVRAKLVAEIKDRFDIKVTYKQFTKKGELQTEYDRLKKEHAPKGFFTKTPEELKDFNLDELDALHAQICSENNLKAPEPFESTAQAVAKLVGAEG